MNLFFFTVTGLLACRCWGRRNHEFAARRNGLMHVHTAAPEVAAGRCVPGMHVQLDYTDSHIVNPSCGKHAVGSQCDKDLVHHFILDRPLERGASGSGFCADLVHHKPLLNHADEDVWDTDSSSNCDFLHGRIHFRCESNTHQQGPPKVLHASSEIGRELGRESGDYHLQEGWTRDGRPIWKKKKQSFRDKPYFLFFSRSNQKWYVSDAIEDQGFFQAPLTLESHPTLPIGLQWSSDGQEVSFTVEDWEAVLVVDDSDCRELLPFSVIHEHDRTPRNPGHQASVDWAARPNTKAYSLGLASYTCGAPPVPLLLDPSPSLEHSSDDEAIEACAQMPNCGAVAIWHGPPRKLVSLLLDFVCTVASKPYAGFEEGDKILWRGPEIPEGRVGAVTKRWHPDSDEGWLSVTFGQQSLSLPADSLERVLDPSSPDWSVTQIIRQKRKVKCTELTPWYSCDIQRASDAVILFANNSSSAKECRQACKAKTANSRTLKTCCVFTGGVCALTRGDRFAMMLDEEGKSTQTWYNRDPQRHEAAADCRVIPCSEDPKCTIDSKIHFEAPEDLHVSEPNVALYFDFAHPLSMPFRFARATEHTPAAIFHFSSADSEILDEAWKDSGRLLRVIGSLPATTQMPDATKTGLHSSWAHRKGKPSSVRSGLEVLVATCDAFGKEIGKVLKAPNLDAALESRGQCVGDHSTIHSPEFEACLVRVGCSHLSIEGDWEPFHAPWFPKLPFDIVAWQQPAPFCCAKQRTIDKRAEDIRREFFDEIGLGDENLEDVQDEQLQKQLKTSVRDGTRSMRSWLTQYAQDEQTLTWMAGFVKRANMVLARFMRDFEETVESESNDEVEMAADGQSFLQIHDDGDQVAPSGRRAVEVARWSEERGSFLQVAASNNTVLGQAWDFTRAAVIAVYQHGLKPLWKHVFGPLAKWGVSATKWIIEHPRAALFISKLALAVRERLCEKASQLVYSDPEIEVVGLFTKAAGSFNKTKQYMKKTFSPAVLLTGLMKIVSSSGHTEKMKSLGKAAYGMLMGWAGVASGGAAFAIAGAVASMLADAAIDAGKQALEFMIYQEIIKEVPSNIWDMVWNKCIQEPETVQMFSASATIEEATSAAKQSVEFVAGQVSTQAKRLSRTMGNLANIFEKQSE